VTRLVKAAVFSAVLALAMLGSQAQVRISRGWQTAPSFLAFGGTTSSFPALKQSGSQLQVRAADDSSFGPLVAGTLQAATTFIVGNNLTLSGTAPTISSGFGTSPSIVNSNGTAAFTVNVGTGGAATSGVIGLPTASTGWSCFANDRTNNTVTRQTATTTTTATFTAAAAWAASDILNVSCFGY
jgi:hypothetical protein